MRSLTKKQEGVFSFITFHCQKFGYAPTFREIGSHFGIASPNGVTGHLRALERKGLITRQPRLARAITVVGEVG